MIQTMVLKRHYLEIINAIISFNPVLMMDKLMPKKLSAQMFFHYKTMFKKIFSIFSRSFISKFTSYMDFFISSFSDEESALPIRTFSSFHSFRNALLGFLSVNKQSSLSFIPRFISFSKLCIHELYTITEKYMTQLIF